jgi:hypothetical protein
MTHTFEIPAEGGSLNEIEFLFIKASVEAVMPFTFAMVPNFEKGIVTATVDKPAEVAPLQGAMANAMKAPLLAFRASMAEKAKADAWAARQARQAAEAEDESGKTPEPDSGQQGAPGDTKTADATDTKTADATDTKKPKK